MRQRKRDINRERKKERERERLEGKRNKDDDAYNIIKL